MGIARLFLNSLPGTDLSNILNELKRTKDVFIVTKAVGDFEGYAVLLFKSFEDLSEKIEFVKKFPNLEEIEISMSTHLMQQIPPRLDHISPYKDLIT